MKKEVQHSSQSFILVILLLLGILFLFSSLSPSYTGFQTSKPASTPAPNPCCTGANKPTPPAPTCNTDANGNIDPNNPTSPVPTASSTTPNSGGGSTTISTQITGAKNQNTGQGLCYKKTPDTITCECKDHWCSESPQAHCGKFKLQTQSLSRGRSRGTWSTVTSNQVPAYVTVTITTSTSSSASTRPSSTSTQNTAPANLPSSWTAPCAPSQKSC